MAFTQDQLDSLEQAIADGTLAVKYQDKMITYRSFEEMIRIRDLMRQSLGVASKTVRVKASFSKGLWDEDESE
ncbi:MAG: hypothetical protein HY538_02435 [Deltaproteobacteria bacterium]|nr:hypothetical protein [Deltaproteobacteria bacterium]